MKRIALISTYCNTPEKIQVLKSNLIRLNELGVDSIVLALFELPFDVINLSTYCFFTKDNPIIRWPVFCRLSQKSFFENGRSFTLVKGLSEYGFAHAWQYKTLSRIARNYDYDIFYFMNYDLRIDDSVVRAFNSKSISCNLWPCQREDFFSLATLTFMAFDRNNLDRIVDLIDQSKYVYHMQQNPYDTPEHWIEKVCRWNLSPIFEEDVISDLVGNYSEEDMHNYSKLNSAKLFIQKCNSQSFNVDLIVYAYSGEKTIKVKTNLGEEIYSGPSPAFFTLSRETDIQLTAVTVEIDEESQEIIRDIREIDINQIIFH
jgi:hypothetical protein